MSREELTRRQALKRGAAVGGAMLWATPAIQTIGMSKALAASPSCTCDLVLKIECEAGDTDHIIYMTACNWGSCDITDIQLRLDGMRPYFKDIDLLAPGECKTKVVICHEFENSGFTLTATGTCNGVEIQAVNNGVFCSF